MYTVNKDRIVLSCAVLTIHDLPHQGHSYSSRFSDNCHSSFYHSCYPQELQQLTTVFYIFFRKLIKMVITLKYLCQLPLTIMSENLRTEKLSIRKRKMKVNAFTIIINTTASWQVWLGVEVFSVCKAVGLPQPGSRRHKIGNVCFAYILIYTNLLLHQLFLKKHYRWEYSITVCIQSGAEVFTTPLWVNFKF